jgi:hypothetical protein
MKNKSKQVVGFVPYGGLGNQIFQFATALSLRGERDGQVAIDLIGNEKTNADGLPEIMDFELDTIAPVFIRNISRSSFVKCFVEVQLRISNKVTQKRILNLFLNYLQILTSQVTSAFARTKVLSPRGMGWDDKFKGTKESFTVLGNFHSHLFIQPKVRDALMNNLKSKNNSEVIEAFTRMAYKEKPVAIHIRLGDYLSLNELNVVTKDYFAKAIMRIESNSPNSNYWIFTNDRELGLSYLPSHIASRVRVIPQSLNSAQTIEVMWLCDHYIISNSTFSWWGAYLSKSKNPIVIAPKHWFRTIAEPKYVCPDGWIRL